MPGAELLFRHALPRRLIFSFICVFLFYLCFFVCRYIHTLHRVDTEKVFPDDCSKWSRVYGVEGVRAQGGGCLRGTQDLEPSTTETPCLH